MYVKAPIFYIFVCDVWHIHLMNSNYMNINIYQLVLIVFGDLFQLSNNSFNSHNHPLVAICFSYFIYQETVVI